MVHSRTRPSDIASAAKKRYIPHLEKNFSSYLQGSIMIADTSSMKVNPNSKTPNGRPRVTVEPYDPVDCAIHLKDWYTKHHQDAARMVAVVNTANEKRPGGDWESGLTAPEECFARRSSLVHALTTPYDRNYGAASKNYPIPQTGGVYSNSVGMCDQLLRSALFLILYPSRIPRRRRQLRDMAGRKIPDTAGHFSSPNTRAPARRLSHRLLLPGGTSTHGSQDDGHPTDRSLLPHQRHLHQCLRRGTHFPQSSQNHSRDVEAPPVLRRRIQGRV